MDDWNLHLGPLACCDQCIFYSLSVRRPGWHAQTRAHVLVFSQSWKSKRKCFSEVGRLAKKPAVILLLLLSKLSVDSKIVPLRRTITSSTQTIPPRRHAHIPISIHYASTVSAKPRWLEREGEGFSICLIMASRWVMNVKCMTIWSRKSV